MHGAQMATDAELLADLLDGRLEPADAPAELAELAELASAVGEHVTLVPPTPAFRASLREEVLQAVTGPGAGPPTSGGTSGGAPGSTAGGGLGSGGAGSAGGAAGATFAATGVPAIVAAVAATVVLATGTQAVTARSAPGDLLYGLKQGVESLQLTLADDQRDVGLLVGFATERVREAVRLDDPAVVMDLLEQSERLLDDALALAAQQGRDVQDLLDGYASALVTLDSRTADETVRAVVGELLGDVGVVPSDPAPDPTVPGDDSGEGDEGRGDGSPRDAGDVPEDDGTDAPGDQPQDQPTDGPLDELDDPLEDPLDELDDPLEDPLDELDDPTELDQPLNQLEDEAVDTLDDATDTLDDATDTLGS